MNTAALDRDFVELATPVLSEFGFGSIKDMVKDQLSLMLIAKIDHFESECKAFENKLGKSYSEISAMNSTAAIENFELEDALQDWRFALEAVEYYRHSLRTIQNA